MKLEDYSIHAWIIDNKIKTEKGLPLDFKNHKFQFDIYRDFTPEQVNLKAAQIGDTVCKIFKTFWIAKKKGLDIIFTQPTDTDVNIFAGGKVNRIIRQNPILQEWTKDKDSVEQKKIGDSMIYYRGTFTKKAAISVTADLLVHDEVDFSDQEVIGDYESRLQHSNYKWRWYFGHPSAPEIGVSHYWEKSDQKHWFIKCPHCQERQYLSFPESICENREIYVCKYCNKELNDSVRRQGEWIKKYENKPFSGYWIPLLIAPWISAKKILEYKNEKTEEYFFNRVLGLPYIGSGNKPQKSDILGNLTNKVNEQKGRIVIGVDTGVHLRYVIGNDDGLFYYGQTKKYEDIEVYLNRWKNSIAVFDQGGDIIGVRALREKYPGRIFLCHYRTDRKTMQLVRWGENDELGNVIVDRNRMISLVLDEFRQRRIPLCGTEEDWYDYWLHWKAIYRIQEEDNIGVLKYKWMRVNRDDWMHATVYWRTGMSKFGSAGDGFIVSGEKEPFVKLAPVANLDGSVKQHKKWLLK